MAPVSGRRESSRLLDVSSRRILDEGTRIRRLNRQLEALEKDNFQEDPHAQYEHSKKKRPKFDIESEEETVKDTVSIYRLYKCNVPYITDPRPVGLKPKLKLNLFVDS